MEPAELIQIVSRGEDSRHQFKVNFSNAESLAAEIVAFSNSEGGRIFIGVGDDGSVHGLPLQDIGRVNQLLSNVCSQNVRPAVNPLTENVPHPDGTVMVVTVPEGVAKPYSDQAGVFWVKTGADKRRATSREELQRMFQESNLVHADETPVQGLAAGDIDLPYFAKFFERAYDRSIDDEGIPLPQVLSKHGTREDVVFLINGIPILVIECKNATKDEAIALGVDQIRRYHAETPELFVPQMVFIATEAIGFAYGVTWNLIRRNIFNWKHEQKGNLEAKVKSFCDRGQVLTLLKDYILFAEKDQELQKFILRQHQTAAVERVVDRCLSAPPQAEARRGLVWHTQGSGKTFTMIKAAELLFRAAGADKPTVLVLIDRNELEDQMLRNLAALGIKNIQHADRIATLAKAYTKQVYVDKAFQRKTNELVQN